MKKSVITKEQDILNAIKPLLKEDVVVNIVYKDDKTIGLHLSNTESFIDIENHGYNSGFEVISKPPKKFITQYHLQTFTGSFNYDDEISANRSADKLKELFPGAVVNVNKIEVEIIED